MTEVGRSFPDVQAEAIAPHQCSALVGSGRQFEPRTNPHCCSTRNLLSLFLRFPECHRRRITPPSVLRLNTLVFASHQCEPPRWFARIAHARTPVKTTQSTIRVSRPRSRARRHDPCGLRHAANSPPTFPKTRANARFPPCHHRIDRTVVMCY